MSRRVFDVGLDMGRIRNGLKHNKENKRNKSYRSTTSAKEDTYIDNTPVPNGHNALIPTIKHKKSSPTISEQREFANGLDPETVILPSTTPDETRSFPLPPSHRATPDDQLNTHEERILYSSQLSHHNDSPTQAQAPDFTRRLSDAGNFDLKPPPPNTKVKNIDILSEQLFSGDHLRVILKEPSFFLRFTAFLNRYKPHSAPVLVRYLEAQKALKAVEYANALAETIKPGNGEHASPCPAASVDPRFEARLKRSFDSLVNEALPAYITNSLTRVVTESMVREITGTGMPVMRELVGGLAEVFCLADPSIKDCPIVYASEEFYRTTRYSRDDVLGNNCRFLQGPKTNQTAIARISTAIKTGQEVCETVLNYRRDGSPFMNLLLTAPLYDNRGAVRYFIGAQIDVSGLIQDGRGLDSFERYLSENRPNRNRDSDLSDESFNQKHLRTLNEFSQMLSVDESSLFTRHSRESSVADNASSVNFSARGTPARNEPSQRRPRRVLGNEDDSDERDKNTWALSSIGPSGKLPGVYQNYLLVRPHPSLRIIFVSPALRIPGLLQFPFLSRIGGPPHVRTGLAEAFEQGAAVTAKVTWLPQGRPVPNSDEAAENGSGSANGYEGSRPGSSKGPGGSGYLGPSMVGPSDGLAKTRYISCTPLLGSDDQVGVWMVVMVENEIVTGSLASRNAALNRSYTNHTTHTTHTNNDPPIPQMPRTPEAFQTQHPYPNHDRTHHTHNESFDSDAAQQQQRYDRTTSTTIRGGGGAGGGMTNGKRPGSEGGRLYAEFMRNQTSGSKNGAEEWKGDYLSNGGGGGVGGAGGGVSGTGDDGRFEEVGSP